MILNLLSLNIFFAGLFASVAGFTPGVGLQSSLGPKPLNLFEDVSSSVASATVNNMWIATIDGDIDAIPVNEFATVFAGGIAVMIGGVLSAVIVGFILEKGDLYADVAAESYLQGSDDEEFWKSFSSEERKEAEEVLEKIKEETEGTDPQTETKTSKLQSSASRSEEEIEAKKPKDIFSDYGE